MAENFCKNENSPAWILNHYIVFLYTNWDNLPDIEEAALKTFKISIFCIFS